MRVILCAALLTAGCSTPEPADAGPGSWQVASEAGLCTASIELDAGRPLRGENRFWVSLTPADTELSAATGLMLAHGHGSQGQVVAGDPTEVSIDLFMAGRWDISFELSVAEAADRIEFLIDVP